MNFLGAMETLGDLGKKASAKKPRRQRVIRREAIDCTPTGDQSHPCPAGCAYRTIPAPPGFECYPGRPPKCAAVAIPFSGVPGSVGTPVGYTCPSGCHFRVDAGGNQVLGGDKKPICDPDPKPPKPKPKRPPYDIEEMVAALDAVFVPLKKYPLADPQQIGVHETLHRGEWPAGAEQYIKMAGDYGATVRPALLRLLAVAPQLKSLFEGIAGKKASNNPELEKQTESLCGRAAAAGTAFGTDTDPEWEDLQHYIGADYVTLYKFQVYWNQKYDEFQWAKVHNKFLGAARLRDGDSQINYIIGSGVGDEIERGMEVMGAYVASKIQPYVKPVEMFIKQRVEHFVDNIETAILKRKVPGILLKWAMGPPSFAELVAKNAARAMLPVFRKMESDFAARAKAMRPDVPADRYKMAFDLAALDRIAADLAKGIKPRLERLEVVKVVKDPDGHTPQEWLSTPPPWYDAAGIGPRGVSGLGALEPGTKNLLLGAAVIGGLWWFFGRKR